MNSSTAQTGRPEKRCAIRHMAQTAISEKTAYAAWNSGSRTWPTTASSPASTHAFMGGCEWPRRSTTSPMKV